MTSKKDIQDDSPAQILTSTAGNAGAQVQGNSDGTQAESTTPELDSTAYPVDEVSFDEAGQAKKLETG